MIRQPGLRRVHRCRCVLVDEVVGGRRCPHLIPLDAPFCCWCEDRHPTADESGLIVTEVPV